MPTVNSDVEVAQLACDLLKESPVASLSDTTPTGRWMKRNFVPSRNMVLAKTPWSFACTRATIPVDPTPPAFGWSYMYSLPRTCIRPLPLRVNGEMNGKLIPYQSEAGYLLTNQSVKIYLRYIQEAEDVSMWSPLFVEALSTLLALRASQWITGKASYTQAMSIAYEKAITEAMLVNGAEGTAANTTGSAYDDSRYLAYGFESQN